MNIFHVTPFNRVLLLGLALWVGLCVSVAAAPKPKVTLTRVNWAAKQGVLTIKGRFATIPASTIDIFGLDGRKLGSATASPFTLRLERGLLPAIPCAIRAQSGDTEAIRRVKGAPRTCTKAPTCRITEPTANAALDVSQPVVFKAKVTAYDRAAPITRKEWDFAGGAMQSEADRTQNQETTATFVRDNSRYRVRFSTIDAKGRRCEDSIEVTVGNPPAEPPGVAAMAAAALESAPPPGLPMQNESTHVVLPRPDLTMQCMGDQRLMPNGYAISAWGGFNTVDAQIYRKDRQPVLLETDKVELTYAAAVNTSDPAGRGSINSTSQNWPPGPDPAQPVPLAGASIQKSDWWESVVHASGEPLMDGYFSASRMAMTHPTTGLANPGVDEGFNVWNPLPTEDPLMPYYEGFELDWGWIGLATAWPVAAADQHGRSMPGRADPYVANTPQDFTLYSVEENQHIARHIPLTDIDDSGRVNPYPLLRITAKDKNSGAELARTDAVLTSGKDFHCRECHGKGKIAANPAIEYSHEAFHYSPVYGGPDVPHGHGEFAQPEFVDSLDRNGQTSSNLFDQEFAAARNATALHDFYDNTNILPRAFREGRKDTAGAWQSDQPVNCDSCHHSLLTSLESGRVWSRFEGELGSLAYYPSYSQSMHRWHGQLQRDPSDPTRILRDSRGVPLRWAASGSETENPRSLFPVKDPQGNSLPMEQNCLQCHAGQREQCYRDRMYTAGATCYDCHGDMLAVGQTYPKRRAHADGLPTRVEWIDQPDCGSCHTGDANRGKDGSQGYFSAGVLRRAFAADDPSATPLAPQSPRFAVQSKWTRAIPLGQEIANLDEATRDTWPRFGMYGLLTLDSPLYRFGKDTHGDVPCSACHGGAHEVWPNRDSNANDNVTALQLQGHTGHLLECSVCHTADSFKELKDLDGGRFMTEVAHITDFHGGSGVLGGPHNLHPVNDPNWWQQAAGNIDMADNTGESRDYGGWHNDLAKRPGKNGEDQCAPCHGSDHRGTRLSRTPVERTFDFRGFDIKRLRNAGFKKRVIQVAANATIGCDTCHDIVTSCIESPVGDACGKSSDAPPATENRPPRFTSVPVSRAVVGQVYRYQLVAEDPDGDPVTFSVATNPTGSNRPSEPNLKIDPTTRELTIDNPLDMVVMVPALPVSPPNIVVMASDGKGGKAYQTITLQVECPADTSWVPDLDNWAGDCVAPQNPGL